VNKTIFILSLNTAKKKFVSLTLCVSMCQNNVWCAYKSKQPHHVKVLDTPIRYATYAECVCVRHVSVLPASSSSCRLDYALAHAICVVVHTHGNSVCWPWLFYSFHHSCGHSTIMSRSLNHKSFTRACYGHLHATRSYPFGKR